jgi:hypothetical protein
VRHRHAIDAAFCHQSREKSVAQTPPRLFQIPVPFPRHSGHVFPAAKKWKLETTGKRRRELFVAVRIGASQPMIEVQHGEKDA